MSGRAGQAGQAGDGTQITLRLLGDFELRYGEAAMPVAASGPRLMAFVGLHHHPESRCRASGALWPRRPNATGPACAPRCGVCRSRRRPLVAAAGTQLSLDGTIVVGLRRGTTWATCWSRTAPRVRS